MDPAGNSPKYPIPWVASYFIVGLILIGASFGLVWYMAQFSSEFDYDDPDMQFLERIVVSPEPEKGDFTDLNGGGWQALCLVGWNGALEPALKAAGIPTDSARALHAEYLSLKEDLKPTEFILVYAMRDGDVKALRHPHGFAFARQGKSVCLKSDSPMVALPAGN